MEFAGSSTWLGWAMRTERFQPIFDPIGLSGLAYWYGFYLIHEFVFAGMLRGIAQAAETLESDRDD